MASQLCAQLSSMSLKPKVRSGAAAPEFYRSDVLQITFASLRAHTVLCVWSERSDNAGCPPPCRCEVLMWPYLSLHSQINCLLSGIHAEM